MRALLVSSPTIRFPEGIQAALTEVGWRVTVVDTYGQATLAASDGSVDALLFGPPPRLGEGGSDQTVESNDFPRLMQVISAQRLAAIMIHDDPPSRYLDFAAVLDVVPSTVTTDELRGRFSMIARYHQQFRRLTQEIQNMERLGKRLNQHFREVDEEMRLASRLQRDFLPKLAEPIDGIRFSAIYRPASWVSGDIFDVFRIDEDHTGFYVADAVGHGMAASLLTIFIKRAMVSKRFRGEGYEVLTPSETLGQLNAALVDQSLPNCQFVTAWYGVVNHRTLRLRYARGGHPYPILITPEGVVTELKASGGLLGVFKDDTFPTAELVLRPKDKLLAYTDGLELAIQLSDDNTAPVTKELAQLHAGATLDLAEYLARIENRLDGASGSLNPRDDITLVGLEIL